MKKRIEGTGYSPLSFRSFCVEGKGKEESKRLLRTNSLSVEYSLERDLMNRRIIIKKKCISRPCLLR